ncbi:MAG TPA: MSHA biogenesis protein MshK [Albitalea sp.]|uniref:MSHA biogenesis protein MshK n=1 Tax=Piscinibacter sp. TaxID=1903157 RepID=UPI002ED209D3
MARLTNPVLALALAFVPALAPADVLPDPTRPPAALLAAPAAAASEPAQAPLTLQSVLLGKGRTPAAVISGELVLQGGLVRDLRVLRITERGVVLKGPRGELTLTLLPALPETSR